MPIEVACEGCGRRIRVPDNAAGRRGRCPACGQEVRIPAGGPAEADLPAEESVPAVAPIAKEEPVDDLAVSGRRETNGLGVASLVLGIESLLIAWIPLLGLLAWPIGGVGSLLGLVGLFLAARGRRTSTTSPLAGLITNGLAILVATGVTAWAGLTLRDAIQHAQVAEVAQAETKVIPVAPPAPVPAVPIPSPAPAETPAPKPAPPKPDGSFAGQDRNGDGRLNADEVPEPLRARFAEVDADGDGHVDRAEWDRAADAKGGEPGASPGRGKVLAKRIFTAADDFVVDVWHNGRRVPDEKRQMVGETFGATAERIEVEVREGDWLVFNVANNRLRWDGVCYFGAAGVGDEGPGAIRFVTDPADGRWSSCDDPAQVPAFIAHPGYLANQAARAPARPWPNGDNEMKQRVPTWNGKPIWGRERTTWLKFIARPAPGSGPSESGGTPEPAPAPPKPLALTRRATLAGHPALVNCVAVTPDGRKVVSGSAPHFDADPKASDVKTLIAWDLADEGKSRVVIPLKHSVPSLAVTPDGRSVVAPTENGLSVFDLKTGRRTLVLPGPARAGATSAAVSPDGRVVAGGFAGREILVWDLKSGKPLRTLRGHEGGVLALAFSPDGQHLASGGQDNAVRLWEVATGRAERVVEAEGASSPVVGVAYAPDGARLASVNSGDRPRFWDPASGRPLSTLGGDEVLSHRAIAISRDGRRLATASLDPRKMKWMVVLWDADGRRLASAEDEDGQVNAVAFTPDGTGLASTGGKTVKLWGIAPSP